MHPAAKPLWNSTFVRRPPPLWYVTNGDVTVGPVTTNLLVRGVLEERVPEDCLVRERRWNAWRRLERIREVAAVKRALSRREPVQIEPTTWKEPAPVEPPFAALASDLRRAPEPIDALRLALDAAMRETGAFVGAVHRRLPTRREFVTACASGPGALRRIEEVLDARTPLFELASSGGTLCEIPRPGATSDEVSHRLGLLPSCNGIAMVPVICAKHLYAVIELGRPDHAFRRGDFEKLVTLSGVVSNGLGMIQNRA